MTLNLIASCLWNKGDRILLQYTNTTYSLPSIKVDEETPTELALNELFSELQWSIAIGSLRYFFEEIVPGGKNLYLVYRVNVIKEGNLPSKLLYENIHSIHKSRLSPQKLLSKILADVGTWDNPGCTTLLSW